MNFALINLGCRLNEAELERLGRELQTRGHTIIATHSLAQALILNTCAVTHEAVRKTRNIARRLAAHKPVLLVLMGCAVNLGETFKDIDCEKLCLRNEDKVNAAQIIDEAVQKYAIPPHAERAYRSHTRSFIKIQDGCNNRCTYCAIWQARGREKSIALPDVIQEIQELCHNGAQEIILTGVQLGAWLDQNLTLPSLIDAILSQTPIKRLRLSSIEPWHISAELMELYKEPRLCPHLHIPVQSGSNTVLRAMARRGSAEQYLDSIHALRQSIPKLRLSSDLIVGFPNEDESAWQETLNFLQIARFDDCHLFRYSPRPNTLAAHLPQISSETKKQRWHQANALQQTISKAQNTAFLGSEFSVLWESKEERKATPGFQFWSGYTENYIRTAKAFPEQNNMRNSISQVTLREYQDETALA